MDEFEADRPLTPDEERLIQSLSDDVVARVDKELLANVRSQNRKVALVIALAMDNPTVGDLGLPDVYLARRLRMMVEGGRLTAEGDLTRMRFSEVRL